MSKLIEMDCSGELWTKPHCIPPIVKEDESFYHSTEYESLIGPFSSLDEAVSAYREYVKKQLEEGNL